jgi:uncharacterized hydrophobic protein (TIGR00271 family)
MDETTQTTALAVKQLEKIRRSIEENAVFDTPYIVMNVLATIVACYGLLANSPAVVIGAMIIAMLLGPITGVALGLVEGDNSLLKKAAVALGGGVLLVLVTAFIIGRIHIEMPITNEIMARTAPNLLDLMIALGGGAAGAYAVTSPRLSVAFVGVAIATALVPPLSSCSILLARGEYQLAGGAFLLAFTNIVAIQLASSIVMWLNGFNQITKNLVRKHVLLRNSVSIVIVLGLSVILVANLRNTVSKLIFESSTRQIIAKDIQNFPGAGLADVQFTHDSTNTIVRAIVRGPKEMTPAEVKKMEGDLPAPPFNNTLELRVRFVPTTVITKDGILYTDNDPMTLDANQ